MAWPADWAEGELMTAARLKQWTDAQKTWPANVDAGGNALLNVGQFVAAVSGGSKRSIAITTWGDASASVGGLAMFAANAYLNVPDNVLKYSNTHAGIGACGIVMNAGGVAGTVGIFGASGATTQDAAFSPTYRILVKPGGAAVVGLSSYANNAAAVAGGKVAGDLYLETGSDPRKVCAVF